VFESETAELPQFNIDVLMIVYIGIKIDVYIIVIADRLQASGHSSGQSTRGSRCRLDHVSIYKKGRKDYHVFVKLYGVHPGGDYK
jgi:hypothetical protein